MIVLVTPSAITMSVSAITGSVTTSLVSSLMASPFFGVITAARPVSPGATAAIPLPLVIAAVSSAISHFTGISS